MAHEFWGLGQGACVISELPTSDKRVATMMSQLNAQTKRLAILERQLQVANDALEHNKNITEGLKVDLEHAIAQLKKLKQPLNTRRGVNRIICIPLS